MPNDNIHVRVLDSRDEFRPGRSGGSVNWAQLLVGVLLLVFGIVCVVSPLEVLKGFASVVALLAVVAGVISVVSYLRGRGTLFEQSGWTLFFGIMVIVLGVLLFSFPMLGVAVVAWAFGIGFMLFGVVQFFAARRFFLVGAGVGVLVGISAALEVVFGILMCIWPAYLGVFLGLFAIVHAVDTIVFSLPLAYDRTNSLW